MEITRSALGLSDFQWVALNAKRGPALRFALTWKGWTTDDKTPALTIPGFRAMLHPENRVAIYAPVRRATTRSTYFSCQISKDLSDWILEVLKRERPRDLAKIGKNYKPESILQLPDDLKEEMPEGVVLYRQQPATLVRPGSARSKSIARPVRRDYFLELRS